MNKINVSSDEDQPPPCLHAVGVALASPGRVETRRAEASERSRSRQFPGPHLNTGTRLFPARMYWSGELVVSPWPGGQATVAWVAKRPGCVRTPLFCA